MSKNIIVIGGGVIGLCSAYYLRKHGHHVTVLDQSSMDEGASYVNAGYLSPSHIIPLSAPGVMRKGIRWMFDTSSPLYIKPRLNSDLIRWGLAFNKSCNQKHVERSIPVIRDISVLSQELYDEIKADQGFSFHYEKKGLMMLCQTQKAMDEEIKIANLAREVDLDVSILNPSEIKKLEPSAEIDAIGGTYFLCDFHTTPHEFMNDMKKGLPEMGVEIRKNSKVIDLEVNGKEINAVITSEERMSCDEVVMAAGSWTGLLSRKLGLKILMQAGKGYRINTEKDYGITLPAILSEKKIAVTPMNGFTRIAGTMEIAGINSSINKVRVNAIADGVKHYYPKLLISDDEKKDAACGLRPVTPDGLPYIGKSEKCDNLTIAAGHAMMGWSMATATGKLVQETIDEKKPSIDMHLFNPDRKF
ncbi:MAG: FAD-dependent oxidoreductase [Flavobacteriaceae bacterium]|nr:FAD-dependent oxidoreductase [Flavobacteriaceae bacterium]